MGIKILDCTLRDGAHINKGYFKKDNIQGVINGLDNMKADIIEVGFLKECTYEKDKTYFNNVNDYYDNFEKTLNSKIAFLLRAGTKSVETMPKAINNEIIRVAFRKNETKIALEIIPKLKDLGYKIYANPIAISNYSEKEVHILIKQLNILPVNGVSIVDTYGCLTYNKFKEYYNLFQSNLNQNLELGIHLHENKNLSSAMIIYALENNKNRELILDGSLLGMGRDPGNIPTELIISLLEDFSIKNYDINECIKTAMMFIYQFKENINWGYNPYYFLSAYNQIDRTYGEYLMNNPNIDYATTIEKIKKNEIGNVFNENELNKFI